MKIYWNENRLNILISIGALIFGIFIEKILSKLSEPFFTTQDRFILLAVTVLTTAFLIQATLYLVHIKSYSKFESELKSSIVNLDHKLGLSAKFIYDPPKSSNGEAYRRCREIIENAQNEILVLYNRPVPVNGATNLETANYKLEKENFEKSIFDQVLKNSDKQFFYKRIFQFEEGFDALLSVDRLGKRSYSHCNEILKIQSKYPDSCYLKKSKTFLKQTYYIVDSRYIIYPIDAVDPDIGERYMEGILLIDDPQRIFVNYLKTLFNKIDANSLIVKEKDLIQVAT